MTTKVLETREPLISAYTSYGSIFSLMEDRLWPWVYNNFIQIRFAPNWRIYTFDHHPILLKNCPGIAFHSLPQEMVVQTGKTLKQIIIDAIDMGYYLYIFVDRYYIPQSDSYQKEQHIHELFIFGYDLERDVAFVADNLQNGKFVQTSCPFVELEKGYWTIPADFDFWTEVRFLKRKADYECKLNLENIAASIESYLHSRKTFDLVEEQECEFGLESLDRLLDYVGNPELAGHYLDIRPFHFLYEHKLLMATRTKYLMEQERVAFDQSLLGQSINLEKQYMYLRNLVLKYNVKRDQALRDSIYQKLENNLGEERQFLSALLRHIQSNEAEGVVAGNGL
ncbi:hypothetical protein DUZ99_16810 [Xylanibacillus composti]|uniref:Butirosin biosynthesis protein H N-terminal domain-containing protein n=1 Tax=Xylanibacillus composti TaxID=1572762 RepID=A0A8J4H4P7_9BACL|nr:hypothetical protein [Xylanibacillus composti]MDT9726639.1 hypothetical protein [Xylanibacillus composti]GIQ70799.1 hypothetical protein XYCOK13_36230 [Xylanibacillus composti]